MLVLLCCHMFLLSYYIIFRYFIGLIYWQDAQCQFPFFVLFLLQKVISRNILGIGWKFTMVFIQEMRKGARRATVVGLSRRVLPQGRWVLGSLMIKVRRSYYSRQGTRIYPGSAPLDRGKDLLPASTLLLSIRSRLLDSDSCNSGVGDFSLSD